VVPNPNFPDYRGQHSDSVLPTRPVATVQIAEKTVVKRAMEIAYRQMQHVLYAWCNSNGMLLHYRQTVFTAI